MGGDSFEEEASCIDRVPCTRYYGTGKTGHAAAMWPLAKLPRILYFLAEFGFRFVACFLLSLSRRFELVRGSRV